MIWHRDFKAIIVAPILNLLACRAPDLLERTLSQHAEALQGARRVGSSVLLRCGPAEAEVLLDGVLQGSCADVRDQTVPLATGAHRIAVRKVGYRPYEVQIDAGSTRTSLQVQLSQ